MIQESRADRELALRVKDAMFARDRLAQWFGISIEEVSVGFARLTMRVRQEMLNGHDSCHGGVIFSLADTAFAYACNSRNNINVALECSISFTARVVCDDVLTAVAHERHKGKRTGVYDVTVSKQDGTTVALFRGNAFEIKGVNVEES